MKKPCVTCGALFAKSPNVSMNEWVNQAKYCSQDCYRIGSRVKFEDRKGTRPCALCKKLFHSYKKRARFCSKKCGNDSRQMKRKPCGACGKPTKKARARFCSPKCKVKWYKGENVYTYVGEDFRKDSHPADYAFWQKRSAEIRKRDKVCKHCGKTPKQNRRALDVHHIVPYRVSQDNSHSNLIVLCQSCHKTTDNKLLCQ